MSATADFLSTFPLRGTSPPLILPGDIEALSIHVPLAGNVGAAYYLNSVQYELSIHVPLAGNVSSMALSPGLSKGFLSTFPLRGTSYAQPESGRDGDLSIHVPLAGNVQPARSMSLSSSSLSIHVPLAGNVGISPSWYGYIRPFYPRSPCGERPWQHSVSQASGAFLSTFPLRGTSRAWA